jgi:archaellum component FlaC
MLGYIFGGFTKKLKYSLKDTSKYFAEKNRKELSKLFDEKIFAFADKLDYIAKKRIEQTFDGLEELESRTKDDIQDLLNKADEKVQENLQVIDNIRKDSIRDIRETLETADYYLENRLNQISLTVMKSISSINTLEDKLNQDINKIIDKFNYNVNNLEEKLFEDANQIIDRIIGNMDELIEGNIELVRNELKKNLAHALPNPFDKCRQALKLGMKPGAMLSDIELYELNECYELSKLDENTQIDEVLKIYGQLQLNATRMVSLVRNAPELKRLAIQDWIKYGVLCEFWRNTLQTYNLENNLPTSSQLSLNLLTSN